MDEQNQQFNGEIAPETSNGLGSDVDVLAPPVVPPQPEQPISSDPSQPP